MISNADVNYLAWIDEALAKEYVDAVEAACCLTDGQNKVHYGYKEESYIQYGAHPILKNNYMIIITWNYRGCSLLCYIDKAIERNLPNFRRDYLLEKCKEYYLNLSPNSQENFIQNYFYISRELNLTKQIEEKTPALDVKVLQYANEEAALIFNRGEKQPSQHKVKGPVAMRLKKEGQHYEEDYIRNILVKHKWRYPAK